LSSTTVALLAFGSTFGAALLAMFIRDHLPKHHIEGDSREVVKLVLGLMATLTAMVLGLLISSAHSAYDAQDAELRQLSVHIYQLDRILAQFGADAVEDREQLHEIVSAVIARTWRTKGVVSPTNAGAAPPLAVQQQIERLFENIASLEPKTDLQRLSKSRGLELLGTIGETRHLLIEQSQGAISWPFLFVLMSWMTILFFGFGLISRYNRTAAAALFVGSLSVAAAVILILQMNQPYGEWIQVSSAPLRDLLVQMGH
jgi:hypothetical protein